MAKAKKSATKKAAAPKKASAKGASKKQSAQTSSKKKVGGINDELDEEAGSPTNYQGNASSKGKQMYGGNQATPLGDRGGEE